MDDARRKVLFLCSHNSVRSQMAEALLRHHAADRFIALSAGLEPTAVHPLTTQVLEEIGVDASGLRAKSVREFLGREAIHWAIIVCRSDEPGAQCPKFFPFTFNNVAWPFEDPAGQVETAEEQVARFRVVRDQMDRRIREWLAKEMTG